MGLGCKKVISGDGVDWSQTSLLQAQMLELPKPPGLTRRNQQTQQQQAEALKCPRCDSGNTKFCYYNNYSKSQPRYFCKACKRHWTKGGTLRNVPVGGGRKNKRLKTSSKAAAAVINAPASNSTRSVTTRVNPQVVGVDEAQHLGAVDICINQTILRQPSSAFQFQDSNNFSSTNKIVKGHDVLQGSALSLQTQSQSLNFPCTNVSSSLDANPCSNFQSSTAYIFSTGEAMEDSTITTIMPSTSSSTITHTWQVGNTGNGMEYWNWDDIDSFVSTDLNISSWDDTAEIKP